MLIVYDSYDLFHCLSAFLHSLFMLHILSVTQCHKIEYLSPDEHFSGAPFMEISWKQFTKSLVFEIIFKKSLNGLNK